MLDPDFEPLGPQLGATDLPADVLCDDDVAFEAELHVPTILSPVRR